MKHRNAACRLLAILILATPTLAQDAGTATPETLEGAHPERPYSPYAGGAVPTQVFWGETHQHTSFSMDAGAFGARLGPEDAYRFARGEEVTSSTGQRVKLSRPLDFLAVADHSDNMSFFPISSPARPTCWPTLPANAGTTWCKRGPE